MTRATPPVWFIACFAAVMPTAASRVSDAPMMVAAAVAFSAALFRPFRSADMAVPPASLLSDQVMRLMVGIVHAGLIGFAPFALVAIATTKGSVLPITATLAAGAVMSVLRWRAAALFVAGATIAWAYRDTAVALSMLSAAALCLSRSIPLFSHPLPTMSRSLAVGAAMSYVIGLFWHHMVSPAEFVILVAAGVLIAALTSVATDKLMVLRSSQP